MSDNGHHNCTNDAMKKIIGNMTSEMQNIDGQCQYVPLGFPTPPPPDARNWTQQPANPCRFNAHPIPHNPMDPFQQSSFNYLPPTQHHMYETTSFKPPTLDYDMYKPVQKMPPDLLDYGLLPPPNLQAPERRLHQHEPPTQCTQLIDNLVGNWIAPNNSGTYSPFGNSDFTPSVFEKQPERDHSVINQQMMDEPKFIPVIEQQQQQLQQTVDERQFQFNRDTRKPRMVAEVKPMRPSYSDVLTKAVPQSLPNNKPVKNEAKEVKPKKDLKKNLKNDKQIKTSITRSNTNNDFKDIGVEKLPQTNKFEKTVKVTKTNQLSRRWASLDNITDTTDTKPVDDSKKKKDDVNVNKTACPKIAGKKVNKILNDVVDIETVPTKTDGNSSKNGLKKTNKNTARPKPVNESFVSERSQGKRSQRTRKREAPVPFGVVGQKLKQYTKGWWKIFTVFILWLFNLISDVCSLSLHISRDMCINFWSWLRTNGTSLKDSTMSFVTKIRLFSWLWEKFKGCNKPKAEEENNTYAQNGLPNNINMPTTGDEAMKRLLACKGKDPYSILGVTPTCTDDDIKRYYKRQAFLVHPDKNQQPGAEEAFKILVHAFDMIGEPERRASYDRGVLESAQVVQAWSELTELLQQLQQKVAAAANTIKCSSCGLKHKRIKVERPTYAARNCNSCKIHHHAREGDIWAEARMFGFLWKYFACMEGGVYDITEWAGCQKESLKHLKPDGHHVQYRIALGKQNNQPRRHSATPRADLPDLENLLNTLCGQNDNNSSSQGTRRRNKKANK